MFVDEIGYSHVKTIGAGRESDTPDNVESLSTVRRDGKTYFYDLGGRFSRDEFEVFVLAAWDVDEFGVEFATQKSNKNVFHADIH